MTIGIAVRDDLGITHWAPFSEKGGGTDSARAIARVFRREGKPKLFIACANGCRANQVKCVSTLTRSVTCMACMSLL